MRFSIRCLSLVVVATLALSLGRTASAALTEKPVLDGINNTVAVLRHLHRQVADAQNNLELVRAARDLTQRQLDSQKALYESENAKGNKDRTDFFANRLKRLERQMTKLNEYDFEKIYAARIADAKTQIAKYSVELDTRMIEYEVLFGKKAKVEYSFEAEMARYRPKRPEAAYFLDLE